MLLAVEGTYNIVCHCLAAANHCRDGGTMKSERQVQIGVKMPHQYKRKLEQVAARRMTTVSQLVRELVGANIEQLARTALMK
jgi:hypothetical protein